MLAYHWGWRHALAAGALELICVYLFFIEPAPGVSAWMRLGWSN